MIENQENIDYLAEIVVSHLLANKKINDSDIYVHFLGVFRRYFLKEVERINVHTNEEGDKEWNIFVHREGLYDILPEGFFHMNTAKYFKDIKETKEEFRIHREEEKNSRLFFKPFEQEFFKYYVHKEIFEQNFYYSPETVEEFIDFFDLDQLELNMYQKASLFFILPHIPKIAGNIGLTETCFRIVLQEPIRIATVYKPLDLKSDTFYSILGSNSLGYNSLTGDSCIDYNPRLIVEIGPLSDSNALLSYLFGIKRRAIQKLTELFIQADITTLIHILLNEKDKVFILGEKEYESRLNYSTNI
jgi:hypothetical protein